jgi:hypothetical protein
MSALDVAKGLDLIGRKQKPMACCPRCTEPTPLISTMAFPRAEFYCLECGGHFGFLSPRAETATPELKARHDELRAEWDEHADPFLRVIRAWFEDCEACARRGEYHVEHASPKERAEHSQALAWLRDRVSR